MTVLKQVLKTGTAYLGVAGGRRKLDACHEKLLEAGLENEGGN